MGIVDILRNVPLRPVEAEQELSLNYCHRLKHGKSEWIVELRGQNGTIYYTYAKPDLTQNEVRNWLLAEAKLVERYLAMKNISREITPTYFSKTL